MFRFIAATAAGTVVYFVWMMAAWMVLPVHTSSLRRLPNEELLRQTLADEQFAPGYYFLPWPPEAGADGISAEDLQAEMDAYTERHRQGPLATIIVREGAEPMPPVMFLGGWIIDLIGAAILAMVMMSAHCCTQYWQRVGLGTALGVFTAVVSYGALYNWMWFPADFVGAMAVDVIVGWTLAAAAMAAIIRHEPDTTVVAS